MRGFIAVLHNSDSQSLAVIQYYTLVFEDRILCFPLRHPVRHPVITR